MQNAVSVTFNGSSTDYPLAELTAQAWATLGKEGFDTRDTYEDENGQWRQNLEACTSFNPDEVHIAWRKDRRELGKKWTIQSWVAIVVIPRSKFHDLLDSGRTVQEIFDSASRQLAAMAQSGTLPKVYDRNDPYLQVLNPYPKIPFDGGEL